MNVSKADLRKSLDRRFRSMQTHIDKSIAHFLKAVQDDREKDKVDKVLQNQMSSNTMGEYNAFLDELTTRTDNVTSLVESMVACPQSHDEGPPTAFGCL